METFEQHYASMQTAITKHLPGADMALIDRAVEYANVKHQFQKRKDGSPYIIHPLAVAQIVAEMGLDMDAIKHLPGADMALIDRAVEYANVKHQFQKRKDGSPYIIHPLAVAQIVAERGLDMDAILGALLHDCIEDTDASHEDID